MQVLKRWLTGLRYDETIDWLNEWLFSLTKESKPPLFVAGERQMLNSFLKDCLYENTNRDAIWPFFRDDKASEICGEILWTMRTTMPNTQLETSVDAHKTTRRSL
jgi:hypothetical protein